MAKPALVGPDGKPIVVKLEDGEELSDITVLAETLPGCLPLINADNHEVRIRQKRKQWKPTEEGGFLVRRK
jgi:hypothetical protein